MEIREFIELVATEPSKEVTRIVQVPPPELLAEAKLRGGMLLTEFVARTAVEGRAKTILYRHILGGPASAETIAGREHELGAFPKDLRELLAQVNGIHLWARCDTGRSQSGIAPVEEWERARVKMYGAESPQDLLDDRYIALSYDEDGAAYVVLDSWDGAYYLMDAAGPDTSAPLGRNVRELLASLWNRRTAPR